MISRRLTSTAMTRWQFNTLPQNVTQQSIGWAVVEGPHGFSAVTSVPLSLPGAQLAAVICGHCNLSRSPWLDSLSQRNKLLHALHGNGGANPKGKGKGRSKNPSSKSSSSTSPSVPVPAPLELSDLDIASQVRAVMPEAAHLRAQTRLEADEWDSPVYDHQALTKQGGIAIAPKHAIAGIVQRIGCTTNAVALVVTEPPDALGLRGYPHQRVTCTVSYVNDQGERTTTRVRKNLIQLGFGAAVNQTFRGPKFQVMTTMRPMIAKFPSRHH